MENCIFCKIVKGEIPSDKIYENEYVFAFLDINPVNPGHTLVIPKEHFNSLEETPDDIACEMIKAAKKIGSAINQTIEADGFNLGLNNGEAAGQVVSHVHLHIMPRYKDDGLKLWPGKSTAASQQKEIAEKIKKKL